MTSHQRRGRWEISLPECATRIQQLLGEEFCKRLCRQRLIRWCERNDVGYLIGVAKNARLEKIVRLWEDKLEQQYPQSKEKQRAIHEFTYAAESRDRSRRIITRLEFGSQGNNPRFIVSNLDLPAGTLYDELYLFHSVRFYPDSQQAFIPGKAYPAVNGRITPG